MGVEGMQAELGWQSLEWLWGVRGAARSSLTPSVTIRNNIIFNPKSVDLLGNN